MFLSSKLTKKSYKTGEVAQILGVTNMTIINYDKRGILEVKRTASGRRVIFREDLIDYMNRNGLIIFDERNEKRDVIYARVSSHEEKAKGDLDRQALFLVENVPNLFNVLILKEVGSGLNDQRVQLSKLIAMVLNKEVRTVYVTYKDRLTRFGFHYLEQVFAIQGVSIVVVKEKQAIQSVQEELVEDMMSLIASFSGKLYGLRSGQNRKAKGKNERGKEK